MATLEVQRPGVKKAAGSVELDPAVFEAPVKKHLIQAEVRRQLAKRRAGTHSTKNRSAVSGGGAKPWRQKGTGRARQGTIRAPQWAGGGAVFGPVPRSYETNLTKKARRAALRAALSYRQSEDGVSIVDAFGLEEFKTSRMLGILAGLGLEAESVLIVLAETDPFVEKSVRNLGRVSVVRAEGLNVYDVLRHSKLLLTHAALDAVQARLGNVEAGS